MWRSLSISSIRLLGSQKYRGSRQRGLALEEGESEDERDFHPSPLSEKSVGGWGEMR